MNKPVKQRDVFICFSKARPGEAKVAIALKDELEQLGLFAFEYEDWSWVASGITNEEPEVDRSTLRHMLTHVSVVVLILPHSGLPSEGVQKEIEELRSCKSPVILLHWSPGGWHPLLNPLEFEGLNIVWGYGGTTSGQQDVAQNQCGHIAQQLAEGSWLSCQLRWFRDKHPNTAARLLAMIPCTENHPLLNFRLNCSDNDIREYQEISNIDELCALVAGEANLEDLKAYAYDWRAGTDILAKELAEKARFSLIRPMRSFYTTCESLYKHASNRVPEIQGLPGEVLLQRGLMMTRLDQIDEAVQTLLLSLETMPADRRFEVYQALSFAHEKKDIDEAIRNAGLAIESTLDLQIRNTLTYSRGVLKVKQSKDVASALKDFTYVCDHSEDLVLRHSALRARARIHSINQDYEAAISDFTQILADADATPRTAVSAWMDRGALYNVQGDWKNAITDWTRAIEHADANQLQRFRALEARAGAFEQIGSTLEAALDYESMIRYSFIDPDYQNELKLKITKL